jgi:hypothetical protein
VISFHGVAFSLRSPISPVEGTRKRGSLRCLRAPYTAVDSGDAETTAVAHGCFVSERIRITGQRGGASKTANVGCGFISSFRMCEKYPRRRIPMLIPLERSRSGK